MYGGRDVPRPPMIRTAGFLSAIVNRARRLLPAIQETRDRKKKRGKREKRVKERLGKEGRRRREGGRRRGKTKSVSAGANLGLSTMHRALENSGRSRLIADNLTDSND